MFLTRGDLHQEPVWDLWFRHAEGLVPVSALKVHGCSTTFISHLRGVCGHAAGDGPIQRQHLFNVYVHVGANEVNFTGVSLCLRLRQCLTVLCITVALSLLLSG